MRYQQTNTTFGSFDDDNTIKFSKLARQSRVNFILNLALLIAFTVIILSGILVSDEVLPFLGLAGSRDRAWESLHKTSADVAIWIVGLHIALHCEMGAQRRPEISL